MQFNHLDRSTKNGESYLTNTLGFSHKWVFIIFTILFIIPTMAHADFLLQTKAGKSFTWPNFTLENNNYCTWNSGGQFCIPLSEIVSIKEVAGSGATESTRQSSQRSAGSGQSNDRSTSKGRMITEFGQDSFDARGNSTGRGRNYGYGRGQADASGNVNRSNTYIEKELTEEELAQIEREKWLKQKAEEERQLQIEREQQLERDRQRADEAQRRRDMESQRQQQNIDRMNRQFGF